MSDIEHWKATSGTGTEPLPALPVQRVSDVRLDATNIERWTLMGTPLGRVVVSDGPSLTSREQPDGIGVEVEVVRAATYQRAVSAIEKATQILRDPDMRHELRTIYALRALDADLAARDEHRIARWAEIEAELKVDERELTDPQLVKIACAYNDGVKDALTAARGSYE